MRPSRVARAKYRRRAYSQGIIRIIGSENKAAMAWTTRCLTESTVSFAPRASQPPFYSRNSRCSHLHFPTCRAPATTSSDVRQYTHPRESASIVRPHLFYQLVGHDALLRCKQSGILTAYCAVRKSMIANSAASTDAFSLGDASICLALNKGDLQLPTLDRSPRRSGDFSTTSRFHETNFWPWQPCRVTSEQFESSLYPRGRY